MTFTIPRPDWVTDQSIGRRGAYAQFQMFTREGNDAVGAMVLAILSDAVRLGPPRTVVIEAIQQGVRNLARRFPEIHDTEPEHAITDAVNHYLAMRELPRTSREEMF
jgi:hypothetical protein